MKTPFGGSLSQTTGGARLQALPEEIIDIIAQFAQTGVLPLRRTCRGMLEKTSHAFLKNCIAARSIWVNRESLQNLEDIANCERLAPHVQRVIIINREWDFNAGEMLWGDGLDLNELEDPSFYRFHEDHNDQMFLQLSGYVTMSLARSFAKMKRLETVVMFPEENHADMEPYGRFIWRNIPGMTHNCSVDFVNSFWFSLCQAIVSSGWRPKCLEVGVGSDNQLGTQPFTFLIGPQLKILATSFEQLDRLRLGLLMPAEEVHYRSWRLAFANFLKICGNVSELWLEIMLREYEVDTIFDEVFYTNVESWPTFPKLKKLDLLFLQCDSGILLEFLKKHPKLEHLSMTELRLAKEDDWRIFLESIGTNFDLDTLDITMDEDRHGIIDMVSARRPGIQQAIEDRVREGIFCYRCAKKAGIPSAWAGTRYYDPETESEIELGIGLSLFDGVEDSGEY